MKIRAVGCDVASLMITIRDFSHQKNFFMLYLSRLGMLALVEEIIDISFMSGGIVRFLRIR